MSLPIGTFKARAIAGSQQFGKSSGGHDQVSIELDVKDIGRTVTTYLTFSDSSEKYSIERLMALGWDGEDPIALNGIDRNEVDVRIQKDSYQGKETTKVDIVTNSGRVELKNPLDDAQKRAFAARVNAAKGKVSAAPPQPVNNDDIPF